jgi:hypothetical protein
MTLMCRYINQKRFGKFVHDFFEAEHERRKQEAEKDQEWMLWVAYVHSYSDKSFSEWKKTVMKPESTTRRRGNDASMTEKDVQSIMDGLFKQE